MGSLSRQQKTTALTVDEYTSFWPGCRPTGAQCLRCQVLDRGAPPEVCGGKQSSARSFPILCELGERLRQFSARKTFEERSGKDIEAFLADLRKRRGIGDWQVRQAEHALTTLYENFLPHYAPEKQASVAQAGKHPVQEAIAKTDKFRDHVIPGEVERQFSEWWRRSRPRFAPGITRIALRRRTLTG